MMATWTIRRVLMLAAAAAVLGGCGVDETSLGPAVQGEEAVEEGRPAFSDPSEDRITALRLSASAEYEADSGTAVIFAAVRDQDGASLLGLGLNPFNFIVSLNLASAPRNLDPATTALSRVTVADSVVVLVIDSSGSMEAATETGQTRIQVAKEAAGLFVDLLGTGDRAAVVDFDDGARTVQPLTDDTALLTSAINAFVASGATNIGAAVGEAVRAVGTRPGRRAAILLTDGDDTVDTVTGGPGAWLGNTASARFQALQLAQQSGLPVYTVGLGDGLTAQGIADLQTFADRTGGRFFAAPTAASLLTAFQETIPDELAALPPQETLAVSFASPVQNQRGKPVTVPFRLSVSYMNANGAHGDSTSGSYLVP